MAKFLAHALDRIKEREISKDFILEVVESPQQILEESGHYVAHKRYVDKKNKKEYLLRIFYDLVGKDKIIISVYRTSKIKKYWG